MGADDSIPALLDAITTAFSEPLQVAREALVSPDSWETEDLIRNLATVNDAPTIKFIEWHASSLPVFTPVGLRYVLPFYLKYSLLQPQSDATEFIIYHLAPEDPASPYWRERLDAFSPAQKQTICSYVRHMEGVLAGQYLR